MRWFLLISFSLVFAIGRIGFAADAVKQLATANCDIVDKYGIALNAKADLGTLPKQTRGTVKLQLKNTTNQSFSIDDVVAGSAGLSPQMRKSEIPPGETALFSFMLDTPEQSGPRGVQIVAKLKLRSGGEINLVIVYALANVLRFSAPASVVELPATKQAVEFTVPFVVTDPIKPETLVIQPEDTLETISFEIDRVDGITVLSGNIPADSMPEDSFTGKVTLLDEPTGQTTSIELILRKASPMQLSPAVIRMSKDDESQQWQGTAIARLARGTVEDDHLPNAIISGSINDEPVQLRSHYIGNGVYRLKLHLPVSSDHPEQAAAKGAELKVIVRAGRETFMRNSRISGS